MAVPIVVVGETPSLGEALAGLLGVEGYPVMVVPDARSARDVLADRRIGAGLLIAAANAESSPTAAAWVAGDFGPRPLLVVGRRPVQVGPGAPDGFHLVPLPLQGEDLLRAVHALTGPPGPADRTAAQPL
ncbi:MAG: hypothetical protein QXG65_02635 [Thermoplasmata archaeon]